MMIGEYAGSTLLRRYVHGPGVDAPILCVNENQPCTSRTDGAAGTAFWLFADERGSVIAYANDNGEVKQKNAYDAYGQMKGWNDGVFSYTGQQFLMELGLYHYKARLYHPSVGRFLQTDPIGYEADMNLYAYAYNDPISFADATGRKPDHIQDRFNAATTHAALNHPRELALVMGVAAATAAPFYGGAGAYALGSRFLFQGVSAGRVGGTIALEEFAGPGAAAIGTAAISRADDVASGLGDLTVGEVSRIQSVVDQAGRPLSVVGSAATSSRRGVGTDLPIGKGSGTRSDIDFMASPSSFDYFKGLEKGLPSLDPKSGIIEGIPNEHIGPFIDFTPRHFPF